VHGNTASHALEAVTTRCAKAASGRARLHIGLLLGAAYGLDAADKVAMLAAAGSIEKAFPVGHLQIGISDHSRDICRRDRRGLEAEAAAAPRLSAPACSGGHLPP
jgi:hypothetical protein